VADLAIKQQFDRDAGPTGIGLRVIPADCLVAFEDLRDEGREPLFAAGVSEWGAVATEKRGLWINWFIDVTDRMPSGFASSVIAPCNCFSFSLSGLPGVVPFVR
jgi:hypothetical protein